MLDKSDKTRSSPYIGNKNHTAKSFKLFYIIMQLMAINVCLPTYIIGCIQIRQEIKADLTILLEF
jgi:hypothetical protein